MNTVSLEWEARCAPQTDVENPGPLRAVKLWVEFPGAKDSDQEGPVPISHRVLQEEVPDSVQFLGAWLERARSIVWPGLARWRRWRRREPLGRQPKHEA